MHVNVLHVVVPGDELILFFCGATGAQNKFIKRVVFVVDDVWQQAIRGLGENTARVIHDGVEL